MRAAGRKMTGEDRPMPQRPLSAGKAWALPRAAWRRSEAGGLRSGVGFKSGQILGGVRSGGEGRENSWEPERGTVGVGAGTI